MSYRILGGVFPDDTILPTGDDGCRTNNIRTMMTTIHGNSSTTPRGTDIVEFPFSRRGLLKKANCAANLPLPFSDSIGTVVGSGAWNDGIRFMVLRTASMMPDGRTRSRPMSV